MAQPFTLRFVLADGQADSLDLSQVWEDEASARELEDDVIGLFAGEVLLARLVVLPADESRGKAVLHAIAQVASRHGDAEAVETVGFVIENATAIVVAQPVLTEEDDIERALEPLDTLWEHLFATHGGLLQVDGEGLYVEEGPVVELP